MTSNTLIFAHSERWNHPPNPSFKRIITTKRGYGNTERESRKLEGGAIKAKIKVSAKNAKQSTRCAMILDVPDGKNQLVHILIQNQDPMQWFLWYE